jgi:hypothetical protein
MDMSTGESTVNRDFGLRVPIQKSMVNNKKMPGIRTTVPGEEMNIALEEHFETNFDTVTPTKMSIFIASQPASKEGIFPPPPPPSGTPTPEETVTPEETTTEPTPEPTPTITEKSLFDILDPTTTIEDTSLNVDTMGTTSNPDPNPETIVPEEPAAETVPDPTPTSAINKEIEKIENQIDRFISQYQKKKGLLFDKLRDPVFSKPITKLNTIQLLLNLKNRRGVYFTPIELEEIDNVLEELRQEGYELVETGLEYKVYDEQTGRVEGYDNEIQNEEAGSLAEDLNTGEAVVTEVIKPKIRKDGKIIQEPTIKLTLGVDSTAKIKPKKLSAKEWAINDKAKGTEIERRVAQYKQKIEEIKQKEAKKRSTEESVSEPITDAKPATTKTEPTPSPGVINNRVKPDKPFMVPLVHITTGGVKAEILSYYDSSITLLDSDPDIRSMGRDPILQRKVRENAEKNAIYSLNVTKNGRIITKIIPVYDYLRGGSGYVRVGFFIPYNQRIDINDLMDMFDEMTERLIDNKVIIVNKDKGKIPAKGYRSFYTGVPGSGPGGGEARKGEEASAGFTSETLYMKDITDKYLDKFYVDNSYMSTKNVKEPFTNKKEGREKAHINYTDLNQLDEILFNDNLSVTGQWSTVYIVGADAKVDIMSAGYFSPSTKDLTPSISLSPPSSVSAKEKESSGISSLDDSINKGIATYFDLMSRTDPTWDPDIANLMLQDPTFKQLIIEQVINRNIDFNDLQNIITYGVRVAYETFKCS